MTTSALATTYARPPLSDTELVEQSELIVVGHLKEGSVKLVLLVHPDPKFATILQHHATLVITEVLKGKEAQKEIPIILYYGVTPVVGGLWKYEYITIDLRGGDPDYPKTKITLKQSDTSFSRHVGPFVDDSRQDNLWLLRKRSGFYGEEPGQGNYGITDLDEHQPIELKPFFAPIRSRETEAAVRKVMAEAKDDERIQSRGQLLLDQYELDRIALIPDTTERLEKLLPLYLAGSWHTSMTARKIMLTCGDVAGERLMTLFKNPANLSKRRNMITMWSELDYKPAIPVIIELLKTHDQFLIANPDMMKGNWSQIYTSVEASNRRWQVYFECTVALSALGKFKDGRAREIVTRMRDHWKRFKPPDKYMISELEEVLRVLPNEKKPS